MYGCPNNTSTFPKIIFWLLPTIMSMTLPRQNQCMSLGCNENRNMLFVRSNILHSITPAWSNFQGIAALGWDKNRSGSDNGLAKPPLYPTQGTQHATYFSLIGCERQGIKILNNVQTQFLCSTHNRDGFIFHITVVQAFQYLKNKT